LISSLTDGASVFNKGVGVIARCGTGAVFCPSNLSCVRGEIGGPSFDDDESESRGKGVRFDCKPGV